MTRETFAHIVEGLRAFSPSPTVFFGGFGEPLAHSDIVEMVTQVKALGAPVELITNGTLLTESLSRQPCTFCGGCNLSETNEEDCFWQHVPDLWRLLVGARRDSMSMKERTGN